ncbi:hypothetical protein EV667_1259 [Ancylobacter aquaticus]|uniref:2OG-Fe(II) oxygenase n=2 Tax=Ancylobacter aquaticus TaxID=100 RepID=A0A4R1I6Z7_ANCAQ|nr:hypothetical protein EV667_1259 [Ancylobacter aquaticus]
MAHANVPKPGECPATLHAEPFPYGWIDSYLPQDIYDALERSFVMPDLHPGLDTLKKGKKRVSFRMPPVPDTLAGLDPVWRDYLSALASREFLAHCLEWTRQLMPLDSLPEGPYRELFRLRQALTPDQVELQCEFSSIEGGALLPPHSDSTDKLLIFVHYFAQEQWVEGWGGATEIYSPPKPAQRVNFSNFFLPRDQVDLIGSSAFRPNRLFFFAKNDRAWHGVSALSPESNLPRRSFNFSLRIRADAKIDPAIEGLQARIRTQEQQAFPA